jgi:hypothetical protein
LTPISFPGQDVDKTEAVDTLGIIGYANVTGTMTGDFKTLQENIYLIRNILDGAQYMKSTFKSPFVNTTANTVIKRGHIGTITSAGANKVNDTNALFSTWGIVAGDFVKNLRTGIVSIITVVR